MFETKGVMGLNAREKYIKQYNSAESLNLANDKIYAREILQQSDIPVPEILGLIQDRKEIDFFDFDALPKEFVVKPSQGSRGRGILVLKKYKDGVFQKPNRTFITKKELQRHCMKTIDGAFSMSAIDTVVVEEKLTIDPRFSEIGAIGLPDIRVIVVNLVPLMAMLRLPTKKSEGKGNLHAGAWGLGIDLKTGKLFHGITEGGSLTMTSELRNFEVPFWNEILAISVKCQEASQIGYVGVDITIDKNLGPVVIELNAQPGLEIQNANMAPLQSRLERVKNFKVKNVKEGVNLGQELFGQRAADLKYVTTDHIIGREEEVQVISRLGTIRNIQAKISPNMQNSRMDLELAKRLGYKTNNKTFEVKFYLKGHEIETKMEYFQKEEGSDDVFYIGRKDLKGFLIDPLSDAKPPISKVVKGLQKSNTKENVPIIEKDIDDFIINIDKSLSLISLLRPENLTKEKEIFFESKTYNPHFRYRKVNFDVQTLTNTLKSLDCGTSSIGKILEYKKQEILQKLKLIDSIGTRNFGKASNELYGDIKSYTLSTLKKEAGDYRYGEMKIDKRTKILNIDEIVKETEVLLKKYKLSRWKIIVKNDMIARFSVSKSGAIFIQNGIKMTKTQLRSTLAHEIETHVLTAHNGSLQPYKVFLQGWGDYLATQEGLAIYNQMKIEQSNDKYERLSRDLEILHVACKTSFRDVFEYAMQYTDDTERAWNVALRMKRGVGETQQAQAFTKRIVYYRGYHLVKKYMDNNPNLNALYCGKVNLEHIDLLSGITDINFENILIPNFLK